MRGISMRRRDCAIVGSVLTYRWYAGVVDWALARISGAGVWPDSLETLEMPGGTMENKTCKCGGDLVEAKVRTMGLLGFLANKKKYLATAYICTQCYAVQWYAKPIGSRP